MTQTEFWDLFHRFVETDDEQEAAALGDQLSQELAAHDQKLGFETSSSSSPDPSANSGHTKNLRS